MAKYFSTYESYTVLTYEECKSRAGACSRLLLHVKQTNMRARGLIFFFFHLSVPPFAVFGLGRYFLFPWVVCWTAFYESWTIASRHIILALIARLYFCVISSTAPSDWRDFESLLAVKFYRQASGGFLARKKANMICARPSEDLTPDASNSAQINNAETRAKVGEATFILR